MWETIIAFGWSPWLTWAVIFLHYISVIIVVSRVLLRDRLEPVVRLSWIMLISLVPVVGVVAYLLFGEIRLNRAKGRRIRAVRERLTLTWATRATSSMPADIDGLPAFAAGRAMSQLVPVEGNSITLLPEGDEMMEDMLAEISKAQSSVHILFYIWLPDGIGTRMAEAVAAAAKRGVACRVLVDSIGSRQLVRSPLWKQMGEAGVELRRALPFKNPLFEVVFQRLDVRNHRKIIVVDNAVSWMGSRNCADAAFALKPRFAPWVDVLTRVEGPIVRQLQTIFFADWLLYSDDGPLEMLAQPQPNFTDGALAQVIASGPEQTEIGMSETLCALAYAAREKLWATTPYYLPDAAVQQALMGAARRGVEVVLVLPARNDSWVIAAASRSLYESLLRAGVKIFAYEGGLIHAKILTVDGHLGLIGSANLDRRSFDLNYECSLLIEDERVISDLDARQKSYQSQGRFITLEEVMGWSSSRRAFNNLIALAGPLL